MTAPLTLNNKEIIKENTLRISVYQLLDAIDDNNITKIETLMGMVLRNNMPSVTIVLFYNYALKKDNVDVCKYFKLLLMSLYNIA